jgi:dolichyl-phosphate beta-glucosyltransferase
MNNPSASYLAYTRWRDTPNDRPVDLTVVIPAFNEQARIIPTIAAWVAHLAPRDLCWEIVVSDDGSTDDTTALIELIGHVNVRLVRAPRNAGKGAAVHRGFSDARGRMVLFCDADNATPVQELDGLIARLESGADVAVGSRAAHGADVNNRSFLRTAMTTGLRRLVSLGLGIGVTDTQCGFKLFTADAARRVCAVHTIDGFAFDLEMLFLAERLGLVVSEVPVRWFDAPGSTVRPLREAVRFVASIARIRLNTARGVYAHA